MKRVDEVADRGKRNTVNRTFSLYQGDLELITWGAEYLGGSNSDLVRSAVRAFVTNLQAVAKQNQS